MSISFIGKSKCSICGTILEADHDVVGHIHFLDQDHPLWRFSDSAMHRACYEQWEHHDFFEAVNRKHTELFERRPSLLPKGANFNNLTNEETDCISEAIDSWLVQESEEMRKFIDEQWSLRNP